MGGVSIISGTHKSVSGTISDLKIIVFSTSIFIFTDNIPPHFLFVNIFFNLATREFGS